MIRLRFQRSLKITTTVPLMESLDYPEDYNDSFSSMDNRTDDYNDPFSSMDNGTDDYNAGPLSSIFSKSTAKLAKHSNRVSTSSSMDNRKDCFRLDAGEWHLFSSMKHARISAAASATYCHDSKGEEIFF